MASASFTFNRPDGVKDGDVILIERIDMAEGNAVATFSYYDSYREKFMTSSGMTVTLPNENTVVATYTYSGLLAEPKATYIPSPY